MNKSNINIQLSRRAISTLLILQTITDSELKFTLSALRKYITNAVKNISDSLKELNDKGFITLEGLSKLKIVNKIPFPKYMTMEMADNERELLGVLYGVIDKLPDTLDSKAYPYIEIHAGIKNTTCKDLFLKFKRANNPINHDFFTEVEYTCLGLTDITEKKELVQCEDERVDYMQEDFSSFKREFLEFKNAAELRDAEQTQLLKEILSAFKDVIILGKSKGVDLPAGVTQVMQKVFGNK